MTSSVGSVGSQRWARFRAEENATLRWWQPVRAVRACMAGPETQHARHEKALQASWLGVVNWVLVLGGGAGCWVLLRALLRNGSVGTRRCRLCQCARQCESQRRRPALPSPAAPAIPHAL
ncbi:hypothetical protein BDZ91DRAFT_762161 [Kalaharituber pfeilii]|nr:hypothetical protein BDZ91DRAFT_762161 [Kalaharituber pfeilii]